MQLTDSERANAVLGAVAVEVQYRSPIADSFAESDGEHRRDRYLREKSPRFTERCGVVSRGDACGHYKDHSKPYPFGSRRTRSPMMFR